MSKKIQQQTGFTLIEMMVTIAIIAIVTGFAGWGYVQYHQRSAVEASARTLRSALNNAKDNAKNGRYMSSPFTAGSEGGVADLGSGAACYVGDLTSEGRTKEPGYVDAMNSVSCIPADRASSGGGGVGPQSESGTENLGGGAFNDLAGPTGSAQGSYYSWLEFVTSGGIVLDNWGVFFNVSQPGKIETRALCKTRPRCVSSTADNKIIAWHADLPKYYSMNVGGNYTYPDLSATVAKIDFLETGVRVLKPRPKFTSSNLIDEDPRFFPGVEFEPLYLSVKSPLDVNKNVDFGESCYGEKRNEIVIGDEEGRYLYKFEVGSAGDVSEGCFCAGNLRGVADVTTCVSNAVGVGPCSSCAIN